MTATNSPKPSAAFLGEAEDAGLEPQEILAEVEGLAEAMRLCGA